MAVDTSDFESVRQEWEGDLELLGEVVTAKLKDGAPMVVVRAVLHLGSVSENDRISVLRYINIGAIQGETRWEVSVDIDQGDPVCAMKALIRAVNIGRS